MFEVSKIFFVDVFERCLLCSPRQVFNRKNIKNSIIVKHYYNLK